MYLVRWERAALDDPHAGRVGSARIPAGDQLPAFRS